MSQEKKRIRAEFYKEVLLRDKKCRLCGNMKGPFDVHHITNRDLLPNGGYVKENGILLCEKCHLEVEKDAANRALGLYKLIKSDYAAAVIASEKLSGKAKETKEV